jgi:hypothetical protein
VHFFYIMNQQDLHYLNQAYVVLIPKKPFPETIIDYRPISLIHIFTKIISKILANRLSPELHHLISTNQTAFIKKRCIHNNFMYMQQVIKELHKRKIPALFIKLDISRAFDSVNWLYLLDIMSFIGFGQRWRNWISSLWCTASSNYLLNGEPGRKILHCRGVRQGDPLSPMFFLLAMEPLHRLFQKARQCGLLGNLSQNYLRFRTSLYADDASIFIQPSPQEFRVSISILHFFAEASGLTTNLSKTEVFPIQCAEVDLSFLQQVNINLSSFPCHYLGLPLHFKKIPRAMFHQVIQKVGNRLPDWQRGFMSYPGKELLVKTVLSSLPTYFLTVFKMPKWGYAKIDRFRRNFL